MVTIMVTIVTMDFRGLHILVCILTKNQVVLSKKTIHKQGQRDHLWEKSSGKFKD